MRGVLLAEFVIEATCILVSLFGEFLFKKRTIRGTPDLSVFSVPDETTPAGFCTTVAPVLVCCSFKRGSLEFVQLDMGCRKIDTPGTICPKKK